MMRALLGALAVVVVITTAAIAQPATPNYEGLWWARPAGAESGWGINFAHQGEVIFATWFTYDGSRRDWWLSMTAFRVSPSLYSGTLIETHGPAFNAVPFSPSEVTTTAVGTGTIAFSDANNGYFTYSVRGVAQSRAITREVFGPLPVCTFGAQPDLTLATNYQDIWWAAPAGAESGWGMNLTQQGDTIFVTWFTYDSDHNPRWLSATAQKTAPGTYAGTLYRASGPAFDAQPFDPATVVLTPVGDLTLTFANGNSATFRYTVDGIMQTKTITRQILRTPGTVCETSGVGPPEPANPQYLVSGPTAFAPGCDGVAPTGTLYVNAEVEPFVAINPRDPNSVIGVWQQDRWSDGGARGNLTAVSKNGGETWSPRMAKFTRCSGGTPGNGGDYERASDPWVTFAPDGTAYQIALTFSNATPGSGSANAVLVSRSADGGGSWSDPVTLIRDGSDFFNDKESITADPTDARYVYAVWDRTNATRGPSWFTRSTDSGASWEVSRAIYDPGVNNQTLNNQIVVLPDGTLVDFFSRFITAANGNASVALAIVRSRDKGVTWSPPIVISGVQALGASDPETGAPIRDGSNLGSIAVGPNGNLFVVWQDARFSNGLRDGIALSRSQDGGLTWSPPVRINSVPATQAFLPAVNVASDGTIGVTYYDFRNNTADRATLPTDYWLVRSADGGQSWRESHVTGPFDFATAPNAEGLFLGDYQGLVSAGSVFVPFYARNNAGTPANLTDIFSGRMSPDSTSGAAIMRGALSASGRESTFRAEPAPDLVATPELDRSFAESAARTKARRVVGNRR